MSSDEEEVLTINKEYARKYEERKKAEELSKLRERYGDIPLEDEESSSSSELEDEEAMGVTDRNELDFLRTLSLLKSKSQDIYQKDTHFFESEGESSDEESAAEVEEKPLYLKDYERQRLLERGERALVSDSEDEEADPNHSKTYHEEQEEIRQNLKSIAMATDDTSDSEDLLKVRRKSKREQVTEEKDYTRWLKGERAQMDKKYAKEMDALKRYWTDPSLDPDECFLRDYILNRGYLDMNAYKIPTYKDIVQDGGSEDSSQSEEEGESEGLQDTLVSTDEEDVDMQEQFERVYNFRFEEPGGLEIASYPRNIPGSVRRVSDTRKEKRKAREERKESEKEKKREELRRLKNLKRQEIMRKLDRIKAITGNPNVGFKEEELEGDFDPQAYDKMMEEAFAQDYYQQDEEEKPVFSADEDIDDDEEDWGEYNEEGWDEDLHCEHPDFNMDVDFDPTSTPAGGSTETYIVSFRNKKSNKLSKFAEAVSSQKPYHDPDEKTFEEYFDEYYKLDFEDIIGDMPCRFKYREVIPMNFGLTTEEVLQAEDKELNKWVSLKKATQYRSLEEEKEDAAKYRKKGRHRKKKSQILTSVYQGRDDSKEDLSHRKDGEFNKAKGKGRKRQWEKKGQSFYAAEESQQIPKRKRRYFDQPTSSKNGSQSKDSLNVSDSRLKAYGLKGKEMKKFKWKKRTRPQ